jgi:hypothetical protein
LAHPWLKFYPRDWRGDQALRAVSIAARGLWIEMLCIMHEAQPYGHLILGGRAVSTDVLARVAGLGVDECGDLIVELENAGVLSRTRKAVIYSRRMVKDHSRAEKGRKSVNKRWKQEAENKEENGAPNRSPDRKPTTQKPEARVSVDKSTGGEPPDPIKQMFDLGVTLLKSQGHDEREARSLIGKWRKGRQDGDVAAALVDAKTRSISNLVEWMPRRLNSTGGPGNFMETYEREMQQRARA